MACRLVGAKPLSEPVLEYYWFDPKEQTLVNTRQNFHIFLLENVFKNVVC